MTSDFLHSLNSLRKQAVQSLGIANSVNSFVNSVTTVLSVDEYNDFIDGQYERIQTGLREFINSAQESESFIETLRTLGLVNNSLEAVDRFITTTAPGIGTKLQQKHSIKCEWLDYGSIENNTLTVYVDDQPGFYFVFPAHAPADFQHMNIYIQSQFSAYCERAKLIINDTLENLQVMDIITTFVDSFFQNANASVADFVSLIKSQFNGLTGQGYEFYKNILRVWSSGPRSVLSYIAECYNTIKTSTCDGQANWNIVNSNSVTEAFSFGTVLSAIGGLVSAIGTVITICGQVWGAIIMAIGTAVSFIPQLITQKVSESEQAIFDFKSGSTRYCDPLITMEISQAIVDGLTGSIWQHSYQTVYNKLIEMGVEDQPQSISLFNLTGWVWKTNVLGPVFTIQLFLNLSTVPSLWNPSLSTYKQPNAWISLSGSTYSWANRDDTNRTIIDALAGGEGLFMSTGDPTTDTDYGLASLWGNTILALMIFVGWTYTNNNGLDKGLCPKPYNYSSFLTSGQIALLQSIMGNLYVSGANLSYKDAALYAHDKLVWSKVTQAHSDLVALLNGSNHLKGHVMNVLAWCIYNNEDSALTSCDQAFDGSTLTGLYAYYPSYPELPTILAVPCYSQSNAYMVPPKYDVGTAQRAFVIGTVVLAIALVASIGAAIGLKIWASRKQAQALASAENAWEEYKKNPSASNLKTYRKSVRKNNFLAHFTGGDMLSKNSYWGSTESSSTTSAEASDVTSQFSSLILGDQSVGYDPDADNLHNLRNRLAVIGDDTSPLRTDIQTVLTTITG